MPSAALTKPIDPGVQDVLSDAQGSLATPGLGIGVFGWSFRGRGGVFGSASAMPATTPPKSIFDLASAQIRLVPAPVTQAKVSTSALPGSATPKLPITGKAGDLMAVTMTNADQIQQTRLWFCVTDGMWAEVQLGGTMIPGSYTP